MIVITKKQILTSIFTFFLLALVIIGFNKNNYKLENSNSVPSVSLPVSNKVVIIDAGHGKPDEGAQNENGLTEEAINLKIALKLQNMLEQAGCTVILTRSDENAIYDATSNTIKEMKVSDIKNRVKIGNNSSADIFVSIHLNKIPQSQYSGWQTFFKKRKRQKYSTRKFNSKRSK